MIHSDLIYERIEPKHLFQSVLDAKNGAVVSFLGTVRNHNRGKKVQYLEFEAYEKMALKEMDKILKTSTEKWDITHATVVHRLGRVNISEIAVAIYVSSIHRKEAFIACEYIIDSLKSTVPIWKKEIYTDGYHWISSTP